MPAYRLHGILVYFAGFAKHVGFYPRVSAIDAFRDELATYRAGKGAVRFPLDRPLPVDLIARTTAFRVAENLARAKAAKQTTR